MTNESSPPRIPHRIDEELVCVDALRHAVCCLSDGARVAIQREENDPPDFTVSVDDRAFPAEVTSIVSDQRYHVHCRELGEFVRERARSLGTLSGTYALRISRRPSLPRLRSHEGREVLNAALGYIATTQRDATFPEAVMATDGGGKIYMVKLSEQGGTVGVIWSAGVMRGHEIRDQLASLVQAAVDSKRRKLAKIGVKAQTALLLLYDAFGYADPDEAIAALNKVSGYDWFHSVFWAASFTDRPNATAPHEPGRDGLFLHSVNPAWHRAGTIPDAAAEPRAAADRGLNRE
jgi:hypothetical protein